jgi:uncharacterized protein (TIGR02453 family)
MMPKTKNVPEMAPFAGFSAEGFAFLKKLKKNNNRDWFQPRKELFEQQLQLPMAALLAGVEERLYSAGLPLKCAAKGGVFRIYRDIRFSADKTPYKTHVSGVLRKDGRKDSAGLLYVHAAVDGSFAAAGFWQPDRSMLANWRVRMREKPEEFKKVIKQLDKKGLSLGLEDALQRMPRGFEGVADSELAAYFRLQSFVVSRTLTADELGSAKLPALIAEFAVNARPLLEYGWSIPSAAPAVFAI